MYEQKYMNYNKPIFTFYLSRWLRIWPTFAVCSIFSAIVLSNYSPEIYESKSWTSLLLVGNDSNNHDFLGNVSWSLDIELQFYFILPIIFIFIKYLSNEPIKILHVFITSIFCTSLGFVLIYYNEIYLLLYYFPLFLSGCLIYVLGYKPKKYMAALSAILFLSIGFLITIIPQTSFIFIKPIYPIFQSDWFLFPWVLILLPFIAHNVTLPSTKMDYHFGNLSYTVYLAHVPIIILFEEILVPFEISELIFKIILIFAICIGSLIIYAGFEIWMNGARGRLIGLFATRDATELARGSGSIDSQSGKKFRL